MISAVGFTRRDFSSAMACACAAGSPFFLGCAAPVKPAKFVIDDPKLKTVDDLIAAMKEAAGSSLPSTAQVKEFYKVIADVFVENMHAIAEAGVKVPKEMLAKLRKRNVFAPIMVVVVLWGTTFLVPLSLFGQIVVNSLIAIGAFIFLAIVALSENSDSTKA